MTQYWGNVGFHWEVASGSHVVAAERWASAVAGRPAAIEKCRSRRS